MSFRRANFFLILLSSLFAIYSISAVAEDTVRATVSATKGGTPVSNLTQADFGVKDSGKPRTVTAFTAPTLKAAVPERLQANEFSDISDARETGGAIFVVLDTIHTRYEDERDARIQILKFLAKAAQSKHAVTLAILREKGLRVFHSYRTGSDVLLAALVKTGLGGMKGMTAPSGVNEAEVNAEAARLMAFGKGEESNPATPEQMRLFVDLPMLMFQEVALSADGLPGRKMLVWVTNEVPFDIDSKTKQFKSPLESSHGVAVAGATVGGTKEALNSADVKKVMPIWRRAIRTLFDAGMGVYPVEVRGSASSGVSSFTTEAMRTLAELTGGKAFYGSNDPFPDIFTIAESIAAGYSVSYASDGPGGTDFHPVEVSVTPANTQVVQSAGYFPYEGTDKSRAGEVIGIAMKSPLEFSGVPFKLTVAGIEDGASGKKKLNLVITLPGDSGVLNEATGSVDVALLAKATNSAGQVVGNMNEGAGGKFQPAQVAQIREMGFQLKRSFEVSPGDCTVRFLIRDNQTGKIGEVIFPLSVK